jgi:hypothetical protein
MCPVCKHYLRFDPHRSNAAAPDDLPFHVEGTIRNQSNNGPWEYSVVLSIRDDKGKEITRQVVGVGALQQDEGRTFSFAVEVYKPGTVRPNIPSKSPGQKGTTVRPPTPAPSTQMPPNLKTIKPQR